MPDPDRSMLPDVKLRVRLAAEKMRAVLSIQRLAGETQRWRVSLTEG